MIRFENVSKRLYINGEKLIVIDTVSLSVCKEIYGLVEETGSGKSTILRLMTGFIGCVF